jgi:hypothetical protein
VVKIAHQGRAGLAAGHMARRAAHVDVDNFRAGGFGDPRALRHPFGFTARELNHMRTYSGRLTSQPRHRATMDEVIAGGHLRNDQSGAERRSQASKGGIGDAGHRREKDPIGDLNIAYFQRLRA